jgi:hypothetical protein
MMFHMCLRRFRRMMRRVVLVPIRKMRMVSRYMMLAIFMLPRRLSMMARRVFMVLRGFMVMLNCLLRHKSS